MRYLLVQDDDCHWYIIPADKRDAFFAWLEGQDASDGYAPDWANRFGGGPESVTFEKPEIFGEKYGDHQRVPPEVLSLIEQLSMDGVVPVPPWKSMYEVVLERFKIRIDQAKALLKEIKK